MGTRNKIIVTLACKECGGAFTRYACQLKTPTGRTPRGRFCSKDCLHEFRRHGSHLRCAWCRSRFYRRHGEQKARSGESVSLKQFCSRPCYREWRADKRTSYPKDGVRHKHRVIAETVLGRPLKLREVVHHIDEDKQNYQPSNLAIFPTQAEHARCHFGHMTHDELRGFSLTETAARERSRDQNCSG